MGRGGGERGRERERIIKPERERDSKGWQPKYIQSSNSKAELHFKNSAG